MMRLSTSAAIVAGALALAACGSSGNDNGSSSSTAPAKSSETVSVEHIDGIGDVLVDKSGMALYSPDQEANGKVLCTGACESFWKPLAPGTGTPTAESGVASLAVIMRPDGSQQVTDDGKPLYTFTEDSKGKVTGNDFSDDFGGQQFTWHAVLSDKTSTGSSGGATTGGGTPSTSSGSSGSGSGY
ncbi:MAG: COG4315 family predicted lipoprotein [Acidimicrobiales bacterium]